jgi:spore germination cell wall hydrolase CwlJ-like protein
MMTHAAHDEELVLLPANRLGWSRRHIVAACVIAALVIAALCAFAFAPARPVTQLTRTTVALDEPPTPVPALEPLEIKAVAPEEAVDINAAVPFSTAPNPAAKPFKLTGVETDMARATDCLAAAIFYEAGFETLEGQRAVAQVVLNRVRHPAYPKTVCGVVFQGQERSTGCQFSFTCDGAMARIPSAESWARVQRVARSALTGSVYKPVGHATHYHTNWVVPVWSASLEKIRAEGTHLFFRWAGWWGTPTAFRGGYAGNEMSVAKLANVSMVHSGTDVAVANAIDDVTGLPIPVVKIDSPLVASSTKPRFANAAGDFLIYLVDRRTEPNRLFAIAQNACAGRQYCKVLMWVDGNAVPSSLPVTDAQLAKLSFSYLRNNNSGYDKALWNCDLFKTNDTERCMTPRAPERQPLDRTAKLLPTKPKAEPATQTASETLVPPKSLP